MSEVTPVSSLWLLRKDWQCLKRNAAVFEDEVHYVHRTTAYLLLATMSFDIICQARTNFKISCVGSAHLTSICILSTSMEWTSRSSLQCFHLLL